MVEPVLPRVLPPPVEAEHFMQVALPQALLKLLTAQGVQDTTPPLEYLPGEQRERFPTTLGRSLRVCVGG